VVGTPPWQGQGDRHRSRPCPNRLTRAAIRPDRHHSYSPPPPGIRHRRCRGRAHAHRSAARRRNEVAPDHDAVIAGNSPMIKAVPIFAFALTFPLTAFRSPGGKSRRGPG
jgi:hypothetical protein